MESSLFVGDQYLLYFSRINTPKKNSYPKNTICNEAIKVTIK